jgi:hypothetical protein
MLRRITHIELRINTSANSFGGFSGVVNNHSGKRREWTRMSIAKGVESFPHVILPLWI